MGKRASGTLRRAAEPPGLGRDARSGGQPTWIDEPEWPIGAHTGQPMQFIAQYALRDELVPGSDGRMAYLFMSADPETFFVDGTWDPEWGENAVIVQPSGSPVVEVDARAVGPTVSLAAWFPTAQTVIEPAYVPDVDRAAWTDAEWDAWGAQLAVGDKVGGTPYFLQGEEFPECATMTRLLAEVTGAPYEINLGLPASAPRSSPTT